MAPRQEDQGVEQGFEQQSLEQLGHGMLEPKELMGTTELSSDQEDGGDSFACGEALLQDEVSDGPQSGEDDVVKVKELTPVDEPTMPLPQDLPHGWYRVSMLTQSGRRYTLYRSPGGMRARSRREAWRLADSRRGAASGCGEGALVEDEDGKDNVEGDEGKGSMKKVLDILAGGLTLDTYAEEGATDAAEAGAAEAGAAEELPAEAAAADTVTVETAVMEAVAVQAADEAPAPAATEEVAEAAEMTSAEAKGLAEADKLEPEEVLKRLESAMVEMKARGETATRSLLGWRILFQRRPVSRSKYPAGSVSGDFYFTHPALSGKLRSRVELRRFVMTNESASKSDVSAAHAHAPHHGPHANGSGSSSVSDAACNSGLTMALCASHAPNELMAALNAESRRTRGLTRPSRVTISPDGLPDGTLLPVGTRVKARFLATTLGPQGCAWYAGAVVRVHADGAHDLAYEDGDTEARVSPRFIKLQDPLSLGQRVMARHQASSARVDKLRKTRWFPAKVIHIHNNGRCDVHYDDGDHELCVLPQYIRVLSESQELASIIHNDTNTANDQWQRNVGIGPRHQVGVPLWMPGDVAATNVFPASDAAAGKGVGAPADDGTSFVEQRSIEVCMARGVARALTAAAYGEDPTDEARINRERGYTDD